MESFFSGVHIHLLVNHAPLFGSLFALALLIASYFVAAPDLLRRTALALLVFSALASAASFYTGQPAEDAIRGFPGVKRDVIHAHEDFADYSFKVSTIVGILALVVLVRSRRVPIPPGAATGALVLSAVVGGMMAWTSLLGGRVRHTEVRPGALPADAVIIEPRRAPPPGGP